MEKKNKKRLIPPEQFRIKTPNRAVAGVVRNRARRFASEAEKPVPAVGFARHLNDLVALPRCRGVVAAGALFDRTVVATVARVADAALDLVGVPVAVRHAGPTRMGGWVGVGIEIKK